MVFFSGEIGQIPLVMIIRGFGVAADLRLFLLQATKRLLFLGALFLQRLADTPIQFAGDFEIRIAAGAVVFNQNTVDGHIGLLQIVLGQQLFPFRHAGGDGVSAFVLQPLDFYFFQPLKLLLLMLFHPLLPVFADVENQREAMAGAQQRIVSVPVGIIELHAGEFGADAVSEMIVVQAHARRDRLVITIFKSHMQGGRGLFVLVDLGGHQQMVERGEVDPFTQPSAQIARGRFARFDCADGALQQILHRHAHSEIAQIRAGQLRREHQSAVRAVGGFGKVRRPGGGIVVIADQVGTLHFESGAERQPGVRVETIAEQKQGPTVTGGAHDGGIKIAQLDVAGGDVEQSDGKSAGEQRGVGIGQIVVRGAGRQIGIIHPQAHIGHPLQSAGIPIQGKGIVRHRDIGAAQRHRPGAHRIIKNIRSAAPGVGLIGVLRRQRRNQRHPDQ
ncbi:MAG: hypothetical protein BWY83_02577 [bacterium ADurb.Bin478]|nr:MAG: hypothetical protein BWY83_02577 [bacterium ADurb.Bin478]